MSATGNKLIDNVDSDTTSNSIFLGPRRAVCMQAFGTFDTAKLQASLDGGTTWSDVDGASLSSPGVKSVTLGSRNVHLRADVSGSVGGATVIVDNTAPR